MKTNRLSIWALALVIAGTAGVAVAQDQAGGQRQRGQRGQGQGQPGQPGQPGQGRQRGNYDPAQARERMLNGIKERLGATDEEWKVLQPKVEKVMTAQRDSRGDRGRSGRGGDRGGSSNAQGQGEQSPVAKASADLRAALDDKSTSAEEITKRLTALREAREKSRADRVAAQKELKDVLSARQEAVLVTSGLLD
jgi:hypothetical protein